MFNNGIGEPEERERRMFFKKVSFISISISLLLLLLMKQTILSSSSHDSRFCLA